MAEYQTPDGVSVHTGFPNAATDQSLQGLDLNSLLVRHSVSTYFMRAAGNDARAYGIQDGDILLIDRALKIRPTDLVIWWQGENFTVTPPQKVPADTPVWGVVSAIIRQLRKSP